MKVPFVDLKTQYKNHKQEIDTAISWVIENSEFIGGSFVTKFETEFPKLLRTSHCISVGNGTDSLYIILKMLGLKTDDEVITPAYSWISSAETISQAGGIPVFVDIDPDYYTIDETKIESSITDKTRGIVCVHIHGQMCNIDSIKKIAQKYDLFLIEDCAQAHFSKYGDKYAGTFGTAGSFSFYPGKNLGAYGDAGCIVTDNENLAERFRMYARHGALTKHDHKIEGINSRLDNLQAAILCSKIPYILEWTSQRQSRAQKYINELDGIGDLVLPKIRSGTSHSFHLFVIRTNFREKLAKHLKTSTIEVAIHYPLALPNMPAFKYLNLREKEFPVATSNQPRILSLPIFPELTDEQLGYVVSKIREFFKEGLYKK